jgi:hypothetical protein
MGLFSSFDLDHMAQALIPTTLPHCHDSCFWYEAIETLIEQLRRNQPLFRHFVEKGRLLRLQTFSVAETGNKDSSGASR